AQCATPPPSLARSVSGPTRSHRVQSAPALPAASTGSTICWRPPQPPRPITSWWTSAMSGTSRPSSSATARAGSPARSFQSTVVNLSSVSGGALPRLPTAQENSVRLTGPGLHTHGWRQVLLERCAGQPPVTTAVVHPCDQTALESAIQAAELGLI